MPHRVGATSEESCRETLGDVLLYSSCPPCVTVAVSSPPDGVARGVTPFRGRTVFCGKWRSGRNLRPLAFSQVPRSASSRRGVRINGAMTQVGLEGEADASTHADGRRGGLQRPRPATKEVRTGANVRGSRLLHAFVHLQRERILFTTPSGCKAAYSRQEGQVTLGLGIRFTLAAWCC